jgi:hypothetical protein
LVGLLFDFDISDRRHGWELYALGGTVDRSIITEVESYDNMFKLVGWFVCSVYGTGLKITNERHVHCLESRKAPPTYQVPEGKIMLN